MSFWEPIFISVLKFWVKYVFARYIMKTNSEYKIQMAKISHVRGNNSYAFSAFCKTNYKIFPETN